MHSLHLSIILNPMPVPEEIKRAFASGATILTANVRAARWLQREYAIEQRRMGRRAWASPAIEDWDTWLRAQWQTRALTDADAPLLLTSLQERSVWTRMQREDAALLVSPASIATLAEGAYRLLSDYEAHSDRGYAWGKTDAERFRQWAATFDRECARRNWIPRAGLETKVAASLTPETLPSEILLVGFDCTTPAQEALLRAFTACGMQVVGSAIPDPSTEFVRASGMRDEIAACAWWARELIEKTPEARIGVLVPDLAATRSEIERSFRRVLMPESASVFAEHAMPFEFSLGQPLAHAPAIRAALLLLRWLREPLREEEVSWLLLSGFISSVEIEYLALAKDDARRRDSGSLSLEIELPAFLKQSRSGRLPLLARLGRASKAAEASNIAEETRAPGRWTDLAQLFLREAGWPGAGQRDTLHFQALRRWERALDEIALLDFDGQRMGYGEFLIALEAHATETIFSPESIGAPVQIMGALESSGQQFDAVWFLCADDQNWPPRGTPHPLLPNAVQRRARMPHSDADNDLDLAKIVTARIAASAPTVVFSRAERNRDGELRASPVLPADADWREVHEAGAPEGCIAPDLEEIQDVSEGIAWPLERSPGGAEVLRRQAACAFRSFAETRLRAKALNRSEWGLTAATRGTLLHKVLERIWSPVGGALHSLDDLKSAIRDDRLTGILESAVGDVFAEFDPIEDAWSRAYLLSERRRLLVRLEEWMRVEAERTPFVVEACEQRLDDVNVGGLSLRLRADRIDTVADSGRLLIDYKSGEVSPRGWQPPRPDEPQLPLYAVFGNVENVRGVLFARIRAGETRFTGCVADVNSELFADADPKSAFAKEPYNDSMRDEWREALLALAGEFMRGDAAVNPKKGKQTCQYCALPGLCRVAEMRDGADELRAEDGNDNVE